MENYTQFIKKYKLIKLKNLESVDWFLKYTYANPTNVTTFDTIEKAGILSDYESTDIIKIYNAFLELTRNHDFSVKFFKTLFIQI